MEESDFNSLNMRMQPNRDPSMHFVGTPSDISVTHQNKARYKGGCPCQCHIELGGQGVQEHGCWKKTLYINHVNLLDLVISYHKQFNMDNDHMYW